MELSHTEQAFAENLILMGVVSGPRLLYPLLVREREPSRPLWEVVAALQLAPAQGIDEARAIAQATVEAMGPQAFSFSEGALVGPWELVARRGRGLGGEVWLGRRTDGLEATVRVVPPGSGHDPERTVRFIERSNAGLDPPHPSVFKIDEADEDFGWLYTATIGLDCAPAEGLRAQGPLAEPTALALAQGAAASLQVVHGLGVVHGGLSPLALLVREQRTYVSDFGVGSAVLDGPTHGCSPGGRLGMLLYTAPQVTAGDAASGLDSRDDLYALGAVLYHMVAGVGPADARAAPDAPWTVEPAVSDGLRAVLGRLLAPHRDARYPTAAALVADLARVAAGGLPGPLPPPGGHVTGRRHPTAAPQSVLRPEVLRAVQAPAPAPEPVPTVPVAPAPTAARASAPVAAERPRKPIEAPTARHKPRERFAESTVSTRAGGGWALFASALLAVAAAFGVAHALTQPSGAAAPRTQLARAAAALGAERARYGEALQHTDAALRELGGDVARTKALLALRRQLERAAQEELRALLPEGKDAPVEALRAKLVDVADLLARARGTRAGALLAYHQERAGDTADRNDWVQHGLALLAAGHPAAAVDAFSRVNAGEQAGLARQAASDLVYLPGGPYLHPAGDGSSTQVSSLDPAYLGRTEVTRAEYGRFLAALAQAEDAPHARCDPREPQGKDHTPDDWRPDESPGWPVTGVDWWDAVAYCRWRGLELATVEALQAAARGPAALPYPWGSAPPSLAHANVGGLLKGPAPVGCFPGGAGAGAPALDLVGNVAEWTAPGAGATEAVTFGGHAGTPVDQAAPRPGEALPLETRRADLGFRVMLRPTTITP